MEKAKKAVSQSETLRGFIGKGLCDCFLKASIWELRGTPDTTQLNSEIMQQRNEVLRRTCTADNYEVGCHVLRDSVDN